MPELPEVETTLRGILPHIQSQQIVSAGIRNPRLRYPIDPMLPDLLEGQTVTAAGRRGKYLLLAVGDGHLMIHLGMSGSLRLVPAGTPAAKHDHVDLVLASGWCLRFTDPRRFGLMLWLEGDPHRHALLSHLGPEPLGEDFDGDYLFRRSRGKTTPVKSFIMDSRTVVGVGNIYANEALFMAGIHPLRAAGRISATRYGILACAIRAVLAAAIEQGGTTLRDFVGGDGKPGYFSQALRVYGRAGEDCLACGTPLLEVRVTQRSTVYCKHCQH